MSVLPAAPAANYVTEDADTRPEGQVSPAPVLITEQQVLLSTAAAVPLPRSKTTHRLTEVIHVVAVAIRQIFIAPTTDPRPRRHYAMRSDSYLEHSRMAREMYRL
jgi:hypothetical protein